MPTCAKCNTFYPAATSHPGCSSDIDPRFKKIDMKPTSTYQSREGKQSAQK